MLAHTQGLTICNPRLRGTSLNKIIVLFDFSIRTRYPLFSVSSYRSEIQSGMHKISPFLSQFTIYDDSSVKDRSFGQITFILFGGALDIFDQSRIGRKVSDR
ncbi:hypothetical protein AHF37_11078 [Paragonimus kellicotti]|nr:hypothetical protein AHF37_11078 [Paragonimus kellicotti]